MKILMMKNSLMISLKAKSNYLDLFFFYSIIKRDGKMKKHLILIALLFFLNTSVVHAKKINVKFSKCVDGDTIRVIYNKEEIKVRLLAVDTPESVKKGTEVEPFGIEASNYTCDRIKTAKTLSLEYDPNSSKTDKYGRHLAWVYIDDSLLQEELVSKGYAKVAYLYNDYLYTDKLLKKEETAKAANLRIWGEYKESFSDKLIKWINKILDFIIDIIDAIISIFEKLSKIIF